MQDIRQIFGTKGGRTYVNFDPLTTGTTSTGKALQTVGAGTSAGFNLSAILGKSVGGVAGTAGLAGATGAAGIAALVIAGFAIAKSISDAIDGAIRQNAADSKQYYAELTAEVNKLSTALAENKSRMEEINAMRGATVWTEQLESEHSALQEQNAALLEQLEIKRKLAFYAGQRAEDDAIDVLNLKDNAIPTGSVVGDWILDTLTPGLAKMDDMQFAELLAHNFDETSDIIERLRGWQGGVKEGSLIWNLLQKQIDDVIESTKIYRDAYLEVQSEIESQLDSISTESEQGSKLHTQWNNIQSSTAASFETIFGAAPPAPVTSLGGTTVALSLNKRRGVEVRTGSSPEVFAGISDEDMDWLYDNMPPHITTKDDALDYLARHRRLSMSEAIGAYGRDVALDAAVGEVRSLQDGQALSADSVNALLGKYPQLKDELQQYADGVMSAKTLQNELNAAMENEKLQAFADTLSGMEGLDEDSYAYAEGLEEIQAQLEDMDMETMGEAFERLNEQLGDNEAAFRSLQDAAFLDIAGRFSIDDSAAQAALAAIHDKGLAVSNTADDVVQSLLATGNYEIREQKLDGEFDLLDNGVMKKIRSQSVQQVIVPRNTGSSAKSKGGGGGGGKKSIVSKTYTADKALAEAQLEALKSVQSYYREGSEDWLANQEDIVETFRDTARLMEQEYERLLKKGYTMADEEVRSLAGELLRVQESVYSESEALWNATRQKQIDTLQHAADQIGAVISLKEAHHGLLTDIRTETRELEKQYRLAGEQAANPGLTQAERDALMSAEDYRALREKLDGIAAEAERMYADYQQQIAAVSEDATEQLQFITAEYERQYALKLKQYETAKAELALTRAQKELENVRAERSVAMLVDGQWSWVADPEAMKRALENVADAEAALMDAQDEERHTAEIATLEAQKSGYESEIEALGALEFTLQELTGSVEALTAALREQAADRLSGSGAAAFTAAPGGEAAKLYSLARGQGALSAFATPESAALLASPTVEVARQGQQITYDNRVYIDGMELTADQSEALIQALRLAVPSFDPAF